MDSTRDTLEHIRLVNRNLIRFAQEILDRAANHDSSKLVSPEKEGFDAVSIKLSQCTYNSPEYEKSLEELKPTLQHHYRHNSHHPQHYERGVDDMDLVDVVEMYLDWKAAAERNQGGNIFDSINKNKTRFNLSDQLTSILKRTAERYE